MQSNVIQAAYAGLTAAVLTVSDRCSRGEAEDGSGPAVVELLERLIGARVVVRAVVSDDRPAIVAVLRAWVAMVPAPGLIVTTGGTGFSPRDVTPEAAEEVIERRADGLMELARSASAAAAPAAYLSRGVAGIAGVSVIITLPGSPRGAAEQLAAVAPLLTHASRLAQGRSDPHPVGRAGKH